MDITGLLDAIDALPRGVRRGLGQRRPHRRPSLAAGRRGSWSRSISGQRARRGARPRCRHGARPPPADLPVARGGHRSPTGELVMRRSSAGSPSSPPTPISTVRRGGLNHHMAELLGIRERRPAAAGGRDPTAGLGRVGACAPQRFADFLLHVGRRSPGPVTWAGDPEGRVLRGRLLHRFRGSRSSRPRSAGPTRS